MGRIKPAFVEHLVAEATKANGVEYKFTADPKEKAQRDDNHEVLTGISTYLEGRIKQFNSNESLDANVLVLEQRMKYVGKRGFSQNLLKYLRIKTGKKSNIGEMTTPIQRAFEKLFPGWDIVEPEVRAEKPDSPAISQKPAKPKSKNSQEKAFDDYCNDVLSANRFIVRYEEALMLLIEYLNRPNLKEVTIVTDDLAFIFKIAPSLCNFLTKEGARAALLFGPKHGYCLLRGKELLLLEQLGFQIEIMDLKETFQHHGFIFSYFAPDQPQSLANIDFFHIRHNVLDRGPLIELWNSNDGGTKERLANAIADIQAKRKKAFPLSFARKWTPSILGEDEYKYWLLKKFSECNIATNETPPMYAMFIQRDGCKDIRFEFETVDMSDIYFRTEYVIAFKVWQAKQIFDISHFKDGVFNFYPVNIFNDEKMGFYPINTPFLEYNEAKGRYESAEGNNRLFHLALKYPEIKKIRTITVKNLPERAFHVTSAFKGKENKVVGNQWTKLPFNIDHISEEKMSLYKRHIETVTHSFNTSLYIKLAIKLMEGNILTQEEAMNFLGGAKAKKLESIYSKNAE